jgi:ABC-type transport system substrate-binding protein
MLSSGWVMDFPDPSNFVGLLHSKMATPSDAVNRAFYRNPVLDDLLDRALIERDPEKRTAMYRQANEIVARDAPWAFYGNSQVPHAWQPYVKDYAPHPSYELPINEVWLDLPKKRIALLAAVLGPLGPLVAAREGGAP